MMTRHKQQQFFKRDIPHSLIAERRAMAMTSNKRLTSKQVLADIGIETRREGGRCMRLEAPVSTNDLDHPLVLVVEDDPGMNLLICHGLKSDFRVVSACSGIEGLQKALESIPDLIVTDLTMPGMTGDVLVRELHSIPPLAEVPIIVLTGRVGDPVIVKLLEQGADDVLMKPVGIPELRARVRNTIKGARATKAMVRLNAELQVMNDALLEMHKRAQRISTRFQEVALPDTLPSVAGFSFDAYYQAGPGESVLGGDWYEVLRLAGGRIVVSIGDVGGSGLGAAVIMVALRQVIRGVAYVYPDPIIILDAARQALLAEHPDVCATAFVGIIDPDTMTLTYASAGHQPPLIRQPDGSVTELRYDGILLGVPASRGGTPEQITLSAGALLVLYSDGLTEANGNIAENEARLHQAVCDSDVTSGGYIARKILDYVLPGGALDDVAVVTIEVLT